MAKIYKNLEDMLYSLDRTFTRGVSRDVESFFNSIVFDGGTSPELYGSMIQPNFAYCRKC